MEEEVLRALLFETLRRNPRTQILSIIRVAEEIAREKDLFPDPSTAPHLNPRYYREKRFNPQDEMKLRELIWEFLFQGILTVGMDSANTDLPFVRVTDYGKKCIEEGQILPHDPDGYLKTLKEEVPDIDPIIIMYISEALQTFRRGCYLASIVMLGCAAEKTFLLLLEAMKNAISNQDSRSRFESKISGRMINSKIEEFEKRLSSFKGDLSEDLRDNLDVLLNGIFTLIRMTRNEVGHPTGRVMKRNETFAQLQMFVPYCKRVYDLILWLKEHKI